MVPKDNDYPVDVSVSNLSQPENSNSEKLPDGSGDKTCRNCGETVAVTFVYCPMCGQETAGKIASFAKIMKDFLEEYFSVDSKIFRSLAPLLFKPGFLTQEYIEGRQVRYIPPLRMYLTISLLAFLLLSINKPRQLVYQSEPGSITLEELEEIKKDLRANPNQYELDQAVREKQRNEAFWDNFFNSSLPKLFFLLVPFYALILKALYRKTQRYYVEHLIFSLHFHSFVFVGLLVYLLVSTYIMSGRVVWNQILLGLLIPSMLVYLFVALKRVYGQSVWRTTLTFGLLLGVYTVSFTIFLLLVLLINYSYSVA